MLEGFRVAKFRFTLRLLEEARLPKFKGALLRGTLGYSLKRLCWFGSESTMACRTCVLHAVCPYAYLFETSSSRCLGLQGRYMPRPYAIEPSLDGKTLYAPGDELAFEVVLVGKAIDYLPYFFAAYVDRGQVGLGKDRGRYELSRVERVRPDIGQASTLFENGSWVPSEDEWVLDFPHLTEMATQLPGDRVTISLVTPTRLGISRRTASLAKEYTDGLAAEPAFPVLIDNLINRISLLYRTHCGTAWPDISDGLREAAVDVETVCDTHWVDWTRTSTRQERALEYGGLLGRAEYFGNLRPFVPLLLLGSLIHVGEKCDAGNGWYRIAWRHS